MAAMTHLMNAYARLPVAFVRGEGAWLIDENGGRCLDAIAGIGVCALGHAHPALARAIAEQAATLLHTANLTRVRLQERLADRLCELTAMDRVFVANSGAEAVECAFKIARRAGHARGIEAPGIVVAEGAFHGRTLAAISASAPGKLQEGFTPLVDGFTRVPYGDASAVEAALERDPSLVAVLVEPIQGESGVRVPPAGYLAELRRVCDRHGALLMLDEVQTGLCRTGRWFAHQHEDGVRPDVMALAKALGNGVPVSACLARGPAAEVLTPGSHGSTFGGNPLACRAALTVLELMENEGLAERAAARGGELLRILSDGLGGHPRVRGIRGRGLMLGVELDGPAGEIKQAALTAGVLINVTRESTVRLLPPLIIDRDQTARIGEVVVEAIRRRRAA